MDTPTKTSPPPSTATADLLAGSDRFVSMALAAVVGLAQSERPVDADRIDRVMAALRTLRPASTDLVWMHAMWLAYAGHRRRAALLACQESHPMARAVLAYCAFLAGDPMWQTLAHEVAQLGHADAMAMVRPMLPKGHAAVETAAELAAGEAAPAAAPPALVFGRRY